MSKYDYELMRGIKEGNIDLVRYALAQGANKDWNDYPGGYMTTTTPLMLATEYNRVEIVELLLKPTRLRARLGAFFGKGPGVNINAQDMNGITALMIAASKGYDRIVELLLENGAKVNMQTKYGITAYMFAKERGFTNILVMLKAKGANHSTLRNWIDRTGNNIVPIRKAAGGAGGGAAAASGGAGGGGAAAAAAALPNKFPMASELRPAATPTPSAPPAATDGAGGGAAAATGGAGGGGAFSSPPNKFQLPMGIQLPPSAPPPNAVVNTEEDPQNPVANNKRVGGRYKRTKRYAKRKQHKKTRRY
jgi:hypothetical protein